MEDNKSQNSFSKLFKKHYDSNYIKYLYANRRDNVDEDLLVHPFSFVKNYFIENINYSDLNSFNDMLSFKKEIDVEFTNAYNHFELEYCILTLGKTKYVNEIVNDLLKNVNSKPNYNHKSNEHYYYSIINSAIMEILKKISISYINLHINSTNRKVLSKWFYTQEPILSFEIKRIPTDKWFQFLYNKHLGTFVNQYDTEWHTFKALFLGKPLEKKINWKDGKSSLYYFVKLLIDSKLIKNPKNRHWFITAEFFLIKNESIDSSEMLNQKPTTDKRKRAKLEKFVDLLGR